MTRRPWPPTRRPLDPHDAINIQYTSGTTGNPKGATLSHHNILNNAHIIGEVVPVHRSWTGSASRSRCSTSSAW